MIRSRGEAAQAISNAVVRLVREYTGRGPTQAHTTIGEHHVVVVLRETLLTGERSLVNDGHGDAVIDMRRRIQRTMREALIGVIVEHTGREVLAFLSDHHVDPDIAVEIFVLKPRRWTDEQDDGPTVDGDGATGG
ncbi:MAG: Na-translocating system protein MpsC family protein [Solirubrobacteraceae bacterium]|nr:Na-translocating system protein MpsC family protein [Solirubrobacteraceae bacterium]